MRCVLYDGQREHPLRVVDGAAVAHADIACPHCGSQPLAVAAPAQRIHDRHEHPEDPRDYYAGDGYCAACKQGVGEVRAIVKSIFGLREDHAVLEGRPRVYG